MSEQDDADVIEQAPRRFSFAAVALHGAIGTGRRRLVVIAAACALLVTAATLVTLRLTESPGANPALAKLITEVTTVPAGKPVSGRAASASPSSAYASTLVFSTSPIRAVSGSPLGRGGRPEVLYVGAEYCPYCAIENWPLIVALSRFGRFTGLATSRSPEFEHLARRSG